MKFSGRYASLIVIIIVLLLSGSITAFLLVFKLPPAVSCGSPLGGSKILKSQLREVRFDAITKFQLTSTNRDPNGIVVSPDGSVWFGEQSVPGVAHLFPNGTLIEYAWSFNYLSSSNSNKNIQSCLTQTATWGVALWDGRVWTSDTSGNQLVGLDPTSGSVITVKLPENSSYPYTLAVGPDGKSLWFTELFSGKIGRIDQNGTLREFLLPKGSAPAEMLFVNGTLGFFVDTGEAGASNGGVYAFNLKSFSPHRVGGEARLNIPTSLAFGDGGIWLAIHGSSSMAFYNLTTRDWTSYPSSPVAYAPTTLPYFVKANGSTVWFNEHYGNRMARIDLRDNTLTEYSFSNPPAKNGSGIDTALTFALGKGRAWFTEWIANYVGFVDASYHPGFSVSVGGNSDLTVQEGSKLEISATVSGYSTRQLNLTFVDSEVYSLTPRNITFSANVTSIKLLEGVERIQVMISVNAGITAGRYTLLITATDGLVSRSAYLELHVVKG